MDEKKLLKYVLIGAVLGVLLIFFVSRELSLGERMISQLDELPTGEEVKIKGIVKKVWDRDKVMFLEVAEEKIETVKVVLFKEGEIELKEGDYVEIEGSLEEYDGESEVIGNKVVRK